MAAIASLRSLQIRQTLILIVLTIVYLCFELGFNARLLDVVGGNVEPAAVEDVEFYGRSLSGIAAALVVLQLMWRRRLRIETTGPSWKKIMLWCTFTAVLVFMVLKTFVTVLVNTRDAEFRRMAFSTTLMQRSLVGGSLQLQGLVDDPTPVCPARRQGLPGAVSFPGRLGGPSRRAHGAGQGAADQFQCAQAGRWRGRLL